MAARVVGAWVLWSLLLVAPAIAQERVDVERLGARHDTLDVQQEPPFVLRPFMRPGTEALLVGSTVLDSTQYRIDYRHGRLWVEEAVLDSLRRQPVREPLVAVYDTWPFAFQEVYQRRRVTDAADTDTTEAVTVVEETEPQDDVADPFGGVQLHRSGSISRGILAGNNRDVTVESGLRMQLSGEVAEGVEVQAVLTDENTPILPEGTTQRISEFDRVFIQLKADEGTAQLGDFDLNFQDTEFARFSRKLQGVSLATELPSAGDGFFAGGSVTLAGATARGFFRTQDLDPVDGVQGPYRLEGKNGEQFIIVIPGSEAVYLDGQRLTRGESNDYVIDYATGEITFTSGRLVTEDRRITVEFQYRTNEFTRTLIGSEAQAGFWQRDDGQARARLGVTFLREADSREFNQEFGLTPADSLQLVEAGDDQAVRDGAERVEFDPESPFVQYRKEVVGGPDGAPDTIFVALDEAPADSVPVFRVRFTRVGPGNGSYVRVGRSVNGILYEYRGEGQGEYAPVRLLPKPAQQRLLDLHGAFEPVMGMEVFGEWARSLNDANRFSRLDAGNDRGNAFRAGIRAKPMPLQFGRVDLGTVSGEVRRRVTQDNFASFDRTRPVEFGRRWNLVSRNLGASGGLVQQDDELIDEAQLQLDVTDQTSVGGEFGRIDLGDAFRGVRRALTVQAGEPGVPRLDYRLEYVTSDDSLEQEEGAWLRQLGTIRQPLLDSRLEPRFEVEQERRRQRIFGTDSLARRSFSFIEMRPGIAWQTEQFTAGGHVEYRTEQDWAEGDLRDASSAWTVQSNIEYRLQQTFRTDASIGYRTRTFEEYFRVEEKREDRQSVVLRWNSRWRPWDGAVDMNSFYEAMTERTPTLQEIYVRTGPEFAEARFIWEDTNGDGIIQIDEFIPETTPDEGNYARTFVPSDSLTSVIGVQTRLRMQLDPARRWRRSDVRWKKWLAKVSTRTTLEVREKSRDPELSNIYLLKLSRFRDPQNTLDGRLRIGQDVSLFRTEPRYGIDVSFNQIRSLSERAAGEEQRFNNLWSIRGRYRLSRQWSVSLGASREQKRTASEAFSSREYDIESIVLEPSVSYSPGRSVQLSVEPSYAQKSDAVGDREARVWKLPLAARYTRVQKLQVSARTEVASVTLDGEAVGLASFELTDGRGPGTSYLWNVNGQYRLNRYLRATLSYNGRAPAEAPTLHTVRMQLSAIF